MTQKSMSFNDVVIVIIEGIDYRIHFSFMTKSKATERMKNTDLGEKGEQLWFIEKLFRKK